MFCLTYFKFYGRDSCRIYFYTFGVIVAGIVFTMLIYAWKQRKLQRLKDPHRDYYRRK